MMSYQVPPTSLSGAKLQPAPNDQDGDPWTTSSAAARKPLEKDPIAGAPTRCLSVDDSLATAISTNKDHQKPETIISSKSERSPALHHEQSLVSSPPPLIGSLK